MLRVYSWLCKTSALLSLLFPAFIKSKVVWLIYPKLLREKHNYALSQLLSCRNIILNKRKRSLVFFSWDSLSTRIKNQTNNNIKWCINGRKIENDVCYNVNYWSNVFCTKVKLFKLGYNLLCGTKRREKH